MKCHECGCNIEGRFSFCPSCGAKQQSPCPGCGADCLPGFAFCPNCGTPLDKPVAVKVLVSGQVAVMPLPRAARGQSPSVSSDNENADRRTATILFADLCGFTGLGEHMDPEILQTFQNELFAELTEAVETYGGFVDKFIGDALLALFGAPVAHEDDAERALRAAIDMIARANLIGERWEERIGAPVNLHIGLNTGDRKSVV